MIARSYFSEEPSLLEGVELAADGTVADIDCFFTCKIEMRIIFTDVPCLRERKPPWFPCRTHPLPLAAQEAWRGPSPHPRLQAQSPVGLASPPAAAFGPESQDAWCVHWEGKALSMTPVTGEDRSKGCPRVRATQESRAKNQTPCPDPPSDCLHAALFRLKQPPTIFNYGNH